jgi:acetolactate synthase regulatory subunit
MELDSRGFLVLALAMSSAAAQNSTTNITIDANYDVLKYVNQLIGSNNGGKIFWGGSRLKL